MKKDGIDFIRNTGRWQAIIPSRKNSRRIRMQNKFFTVTVLLLRTNEENIPVGMHTGLAAAGHKSKTNVGKGFTEAYTGLHH